MHMWWVFNHVSLICPAFRLWISRRLGMRLVDSRRKQKAFWKRGNDMDKISMIILNYNDSYTTLSLVDEVRDYECLTPWWWWTITHPMIHGSACRH